MHHRVISSYVQGCFTNLVIFRCFFAKTCPIEFSNLVKSIGIITKCKSAAGPRHGLVAHLFWNCVLHQKIIWSGSFKNHPRSFSHIIFYTDRIFDLGFAINAWEDALCAHLFFRGILVILPSIYIYNKYWDFYFLLDVII